MSKFDWYQDSNNYEVKKVKVFSTLVILVLLLALPIAGALISEYTR